TTVGAAMLTAPGDDAGFFHNTLVEVVLPGIVDVGIVLPDADANDAKSGVSEPPSWFYQMGQIPDAQRYAVDVLNNVIQHYRVLAGVPQIRPVAYKHARSFEFEF